MPAEAPTARLKTRYLEEIRPALVDRFGYSSVMQAPRIEKITLNMGVGLAKQDSKVLKAAREQLATIAGQQPSVRRARKSIAAFKLREGMPVGVTVTLRAERAYEFLDRLVSIAIPRIRDFRGMNPRSFDGRGNYSLGVKEQIIFPEVDYDAIDEVRGLDVTITTTAATDIEAFALLSALGMPFAAQGRPAGFDGDESAAVEDAAEKRAVPAPAKDSDAAEQETDDVPAERLAEVAVAEVAVEDAEVAIEEVAVVEVAIEEIGDAEVAIEEIGDAEQNGASAADEDAAAPKKAKPRRAARPKKKAQPEQNDAPSAEQGDASMDVETTEKEGTD